jgi:hypothetical protein
MAITKNTFTGNGTTVLYSFSFPYLDESHVKATLNGTPTTAFIFANATTLEFNSAPGAGVEIVIFRETDSDQSEAVFAAGSPIRASDLNQNNTQLLYVAQETSQLSDDANVNSNLAITTANGAVVTANTAEANSLTAISTANTAESNSLAAISTANTAESNSLAAVSTANAASITAGNAVSTANVASNDASTALSVANATAAAQTALENNVYDATELDAGQLDNRYYTQVELDAGQLDNRYFTETEADARFYNVNTESVKSTDVWTNSDGFVATTAAIEARIITLVDEVGGFVPIADRTSFPTTNPDINNNAGTVVSIQDIAGLTHSGGTSTNATTTASTAVTITGIPTSLASPAPSGYGMLVVTTGTLNSFTFHRLTAAATDVVNVANNATNINTVAGQITPVNNVATVAGIAGNVSTVAGISSNVTTVAGNTSNINTVAGISGNVTTVATNNANVTTVATNIADIQTVAADLNEPVSEIDTVATNIANVNAVGTNINSVNTVAGNNSNVTTVATDIANVNTTAGSIANVNTTATNIANINTVAANDANVTTIAGSIANVNTTAGSIANVNTVAVDIANVNTVATNLANIITAAGYLNDFEGLYLGVLTADPSVDSLGNPINIGDFYWNSAMEQTRIYNGVSWVSIAENSFLLSGIPNADFSSLYTAAAGTNVINLGTLASTGVFNDETAPNLRVSLASGSGIYSFGNL